MRMDDEKDRQGQGAPLQMVSSRDCAKSEIVRIVSAQTLRGSVTFLSPNKKVTKEVGLGEALTVKSIGTSSVSFHSYPAFKPSSPKTLSRPPSLPGR